MATWHAIGTRQIQFVASKRNILVRSYQHININHRALTYSQGSFKYLFMQHPPAFCKQTDHVCFPCCNLTIHLLLLPENTWDTG